MKITKTTTGGADIFLSAEEITELYSMITPPPSEFKTVTKWHAPEVR